MTAGFLENDLIFAGVGQLLLPLFLSQISFSLIYNEASYNSIIQKPSLLDELETAHHLCDYSFP